MDLFSSRSQQLAEYLRISILKNELSEPLPNTRDWARQLAVDRNTLCAALMLLEKDGLLKIRERQGVRLTKNIKRKASLKIARAVYIIYYGLAYGHSDFGLAHWVGALSEVLQKRGVQLHVVKCSDERLRQLCARSSKHQNREGDFVLSMSLPQEYQQMLAGSGRPFIHIGTPAECEKIPFIMCDLPGTIRHATHTLLRRGFRKLTFIHAKAYGSGDIKMRETFLQACGQWRQQPIEARTLQIPMQDEAERSAFARLAGQITAREGILTMPPISLGLLMTTLLARKIEIPEQVDIIVFASYPDTVRVYPPLTHYPFPRDSFIKTLAHEIFRFFETGAPIVIRKLLPMKVASPSTENSM